MAFHLQSAAFSPKLPAMTLDLRGRRFGRLVALQRVGSVVMRDGSKRAAWRCQCDCGSVCVVNAHRIGREKNSCGCFQKDNPSARTHGLRRCPEYSPWNGMIARCTKPGHAAYQYYGGRGISVATEWLDIATFIRDMGPRPSPGHSIDRKNNDGDYEPGNCRWATRHEQMRNTRRNIRVSAFGRTLTLSEWEEQPEAQATAKTIGRRVRSGWMAEKAIATPTRPLV